MLWCTIKKQPHLHGLVPMHIATPYIIKICMKYQFEDCMGKVNMKLTITEYSAEFFMCIVEHSHTLQFFCLNDRNRAVTCMKISILIGQSRMFCYPSHQGLMACELTIMS